MKETEIGLIPNDWNVVELRSTGEVIYGIQAAVANNTKPVGTKILTNINITIDGQIDLEKLRYYKLKSKRDYNTILSIGDILFNWRSGSKEHVGKTAIFNLTGEYTHSSFILRIRTNQNILNNFLYLYLNYLRASGYFIKKQNYSINAKFNKSAIEVLPIALPGLHEQRNIAHILSLIQSAIQKQDEIIRVTTELKNALMQKLFTEGTKGEKQKQTDIGLVPKSWEIMKIGEVYQFTNKPRSLVINDNTDVPFIPMEFIPDQGTLVKKFNLRKGKELSSGTYFENGDFLLSKITPSFENGKQAIVKLESFSWGYATTEVIPIKEKDDYSSKLFLFYYLQKKDVREVLAGKMEGSTGRQRLSKTILENFLIPFPAYQEQLVIANAFLTFDAKMEFHQSKKRVLMDLFQTMLHKLMTGEIRVNNIDLGLAKITKEYSINGTHNGAMAAEPPTQPLKKKAKSSMKRMR